MLGSAKDAEEIKTKPRISEFRKLHGIERRPRQTNNSRNVLGAIEVYIKC